MRKILGRFWTILWRTLLTFFLISILSVVVYRWVPVPITPLMLIRDVEQFKNGQGIIMEHDWVPLEDISPKLQLSVDTGTVFAWMLVTLKKHSRDCFCQDWRCFFPGNSIDLQEGIFPIGSI